MFSILKAPPGNEMSVKNAGCWAACVVRDDESKLCLSEFSHIQNSTQFSFRSQWTWHVCCQSVACRRFVILHQRARDACAILHATRTAENFSVCRLMLANASVRKTHTVDRRKYSTHRCTELGVDDARPHKRNVKRATTTRYMPDISAGHRQYNSCVQRERLFCARLNLHINPTRNAFPCWFARLHCSFGFQIIFLFRAIHANS